MLGRVFLVRHGEVHNPGHICYGDLPEFGLGAPGRRQARAAAAYLASHRVDLVISSRLRRAWQTARLIADGLGLRPIGDEGLTEWRLGARWAGVRWEDLPNAFPGELEAYLDHPVDLPFSPESIVDAGRRVLSVIEELGRTHPGKQAVVVSHQDPIQAARLLLTGGSLADLHRDKPGHGSVLTLAPGRPWQLTDRWDPPHPGVPFPPLPHG